MSGKASGSADTVAVEIVARNKTQEGFAQAAAGAKGFSDSVAAATTKLRTHSDQTQQLDKHTQRLTTRFGASALSIGALATAAMAARQAFGALEQGAAASIEPLSSAEGRIDGMRSALLAFKESAAASEFQGIAGTIAQAFFVAYSAIDTSLAELAASTEKDAAMRREHALQAKAYMADYLELVEQRKNAESDGDSLAIRNVQTIARLKKEAAEEQKRNADKAVAEAERRAQTVAGIEDRWARASIDARKRLELDYLRDLAQLREGDVAARQAVEEGYQRGLTDIDTQEAERRASLIQQLEERKQQGLNEIHQANEARRAEITNATYEQMERAVTGYLMTARSFALRAMNDIMAGQFSAAKLMKSVLTEMFTRLTALLVEKAAVAIATAMTEKAANKATAISTTQGNIASAATGAASAVASIPFAGPALALAAATETALALEAMTAPMLAARGGFDVPRGMNPITRLHEQEMVLPANIANPLRQAVDGGGGALGGGTIVLNLSAIDGPSVLRMVESPTFANALREARRNGARV